MSKGQQYLFGSHHLRHNGTGIIFLLCEPMGKRQQCCCDGGKSHSCRDTAKKCRSIRQFDCDIVFI